MTKQKPKKPGPKPLTVSTDLSFEDAAKLVASKPRPEDGWPSLEEPEAEAEEEEDERPRRGVREVSAGDGTE